MSNLLRPPATFTDDEISAVMVMVRRPYPLPLPTVDVADLDSVEQAASRGVRSLRLREIDLDTEPRNSALRRVAHVCGATSRLSMQVTAPGGAGVMAQRFDVFVDGSSLVTVLARGDGVHEFADAQAPEVMKLVGSWCGEANRATDGRGAILLGRTEPARGVMIGHKSYRIRPNGPRSWRAEIELTADQIGQEIAGLLFEVLPAPHED